MPTGYTSALYDGEQSFEDFAWGIARGFGALIEMRDAPRDVPIPAEFSARTDHYDRQIKEARQGLVALDTMTVEEAARCAQAEHDESARHFDEARAERDVLRARYEAMLAKAQAYEPPTADHIKFKEMMIEQLCSAIDFDCGSMKFWDVMPLRTPQEWLEQKREMWTTSMTRSVASRAEEIERARGRTAWVQALRDSLAPGSVAP